MGYPSKLISTVETVDRKRSDGFCTVDERFSFGMKETVALKGERLTTPRRLLLGIRYQNPHDTMTQQPTNTIRVANSLLLITRTRAGYSTRTYLDD